MAVPLLIYVPAISVGTTLVYLIATAQYVATGRFGSAFAVRFLLRPAQNRCRKRAAGCSITS